MQSHTARCLANTSQRFCSKKGAPSQVAQADEAAVDGLAAVVRHLSRRRQHVGRKRAAERGRLRRRQLIPDRTVYDLNARPALVSGLRTRNICHLKAVANKSPRQCHMLPQADALA